jgi:hypothetical protein
LPPNFSAFGTVEQAVSLAADQEIGVLGISNYYDFDVYGQFVEQARSQANAQIATLEGEQRAPRRDLKRWISETRKSDAAGSVDDSSVRDERSRS